MKIESKDTDIETLLDGSFFHIPRFQRPYSWDEDNINEFWEDLIANKGEDYFIGSMVVYKKAKQFFGVVDGQQRLTTITILLCVLRNAFKNLGEHDMAQGLHQLIERKDRDNKSDFVLKTETSFPYFQEYIQKFGEADLSVNLHSEEKNLEKAYSIFRLLVDNALWSIECNNSIPENEKQRAKIDKLKSIRDTVLNLNIIFVALDNEDDAYLIFETLNTRGKDLALSDLVKNHFTKHLKAKGAVDHAKIKWDQILEAVHNSSADLSMDMFIYHFWASRHEATPLKKIFPILKKKIVKENAKDYLEMMVQDVNLYRSIHEPSFDWKKNEADAARSIAALQLFKVSQHTPATLSLARAYRAGTIKYGKLRDALSAIEKFHFLFTAVTSSRSSGGISAMYSSFARRLFEAKNSQEAADEISSLVEKLRSKRPSIEEFKVAFKEIIYTNTNTKQKNLVRYILRKISEHYEFKYPTDYEELTIEHLQPQASINKGVWSEPSIGQIGNLLFLDQKTNGEMNIKTPRDKISYLTKNGYTIPDELKDLENWTPELATLRTEKIADVAYKKIWLI